MKKISKEQSKADKRACTGAQRAQRACWTVEAGVTGKGLICESDIEICDKMHGFYPAAFKPRGQGLGNQVEGTVVSKQSNRKLIQKSRQ